MLRWFLPFLLIHLIRWQTQARDFCLFCLFVLTWIIFSCAYLFTLHTFSLQRVKDEILRRRLQSFGCQEKQAEDPNIVKTADLEVFHTALSAAKSVPAYSLQECKRDLPNSPRAKCSEQQRFLVHSVCEEPLKSVENKQWLEDTYFRQLNFYFK